MAVGPREPDEQLEIHLLGEPPERTVGHGVPGLEERARPQMLGDQSEHLGAHVEVVERVHVQPIEDAREIIDLRRRPPERECRDLDFPQRISGSRHSDGRSAGFLLSQQRLASSLPESLLFPESPLKLL